MQSTTLSCLSQPFTIGFHYYALAMLSNVCIAPETSLLHGLLDVSDYYCHLTKSFKEKIKMTDL